MRSLYDRLGGEEVLDQIVELHYQKVLADVTLAPFFDGKDIAQQKRKFRLFLHTITGGPLRRSDMELRFAHVRAVDQGLEQTHIDAFIEYFRDVLIELDLDQELVTELMQAIARRRGGVLD